MKKQNDLFDWKHLKLWRISFIADFLASLVIAAFALLAFWEAYRYNQIAHNQFQTDLLGFFSREPIYILDMSLQMVRVFLQGAVYYLVLKGVALGLNMIVETDINYKEKALRKVQNERRNSSTDL